MSLCKCGVKVDRHKDKSKVQCFVCKQFFHAKCCAILDKDVDLVDNKYKCDVCIRERKLSGSLASSNDQELVSHEEESAKTAGDPILAPESTGTVPKRSRALLSSQGADLVAIESLSKEVVLLRKSNEELSKAVCSLRIENLKLNSKLDEVLFLVKEMQSSLKKSNAGNSSPKRKKLSSLKNAVVKPSSTVLASNCENSDGALPVDDCSSKGMDIDANWPVPGAATARSTAARSAMPSTSFAAMARIGMNSLTPHNVPTPPSGNASEGWRRIGKLNKSKNSLVGTGDNPDIGVVKNFKWLHLSSFHNSVSETDVINYLSKASNISASNFSCYKLVKKDDDVKNLKFINFKLGIVSNYYDRILNPAFWPANVRVRPFVFMEKKTVSNAGSVPVASLASAASVPASSVASTSSAVAESDSFLEVPMVLSQSVEGPSPLRPTDQTVQ